MKISAILMGLILSTGALAQELQTGFYLVEGDKDCEKEFGKVVFMNPENIKSSNKCTFKFQNNDIRSIGICTRVLAHRGDARSFPANTIGAFDSALNQGFKGVELDIWLTKDKKALISHDNNLKAATNCKGKITEKTLQEIQGNCLAERSSVIPEKRWFSKKSKVQAPIPTLKEVLEKYRTDKRMEQIVLDIKPFPGGKELIDSFVESFPDCSPEEKIEFEKRLTFISQDANDAILIKKSFPHAHVALESNKTVSGLIDTPDADLWDDNCGYDTLSLSFNSMFDFKLKLLKFLLGQNNNPQKKFKKLYKNNLESNNTKRILGWTINNKHGVKGLLKYPIHDVLTDMPYAQVMETLIKEVPPEELIENMNAVNSGKATVCN